MLPRDQDGSSGHLGPEATLLCFGFEDNNKARRLKLESCSQCYPKIIFSTAYFYLIIGLAKLNWSPLNNKLDSVLLLIFLGNKENEAVPGKKAQVDVSPESPKTKRVTNQTA